MIKMERNKPQNRNLWQQLPKTEYLHLSFRNFQQVEWVIPCCRNAFGMCSYWHPCTTCLGSAVPWALAFAQICVRGKCQLPSDVSVCSYKSPACTSRARVYGGESHTRREGSVTLISGRLESASWLFHLARWLCGEWAVDFMHVKWDLFSTCC